MSRDTDEVGRGGNGGAGGHGAGGNGRLPVGILEDATTTAVVEANTITVGTPGAGGASPGKRGLDGFAAELWREPASTEVTDS